MTPAVLALPVNEIKLYITKLVLFLKASLHLFFILIVV